MSACAFDVRPRHAKRILTRVLLVIAYVCVCAQPVRAQARAPQRPDLFLVPHADAVLVLVREAPSRAGGFIVERRSGTGAWERLTELPVRAERDPLRFATELGADLPAVMRALQVDEPAQAMLTLRSDALAASLLSAVFPSVGRALGRMYVDEDVTRGATYEYRVVPVNFAGTPNGDAMSGRVRVEPGALAPTREVRTEDGDRRVTLRWTYAAYTGAAEDRVVGFHVYRAEENGEPTRLTALPVMRSDQPLFYLDETVGNGVRYRYAVAPVEIGGREGALSALVSAHPRDLTPPAFIDDVVAVPGEAFVRLAWRMSPELDAAGYHVERAGDVQGPFARLTRELVPVGEPEFRDEGVAGGNAYFYRVFAVDAAGNESPPSNPRLAIPWDSTAPDAPRAVAADARDRQLHVRWSPGASSDVVGYYVYRGTTPDNLVRLTPLPVERTAYVDVGFSGELNPGGRYIVRVSAVDRSYNESEPAEIIAIVPDDDPPPPPTGFAVRGVDGRAVEATWSASGALDVAEYVWTRTENGDTRTLGRLPPRAPVTIRDTSAVLGHTYVYRVAAVDTAGNEGAAAVDTFTFRDFDPPAAPRHVAARRAARGVEVTWERVGSRDLAGYHVYRSALPTGVFEQVTREPVSGQAWTDASGSGTTYYRVRAVDSFGNESAWSPPGGVAE